MGAILAAAIPAAASLIGTGGQMMAQGKMNGKTRAWNNDQIVRARQWALEDYAMQNEYNSPKAQMARLKEAGLNPHLVYGNGADAQGANMASPPSGSIGNQPTADIQGGVNSAIAAYQNATQQNLQNNLLKTQNTIAEREIQLKEIQAQAIQQGILKSRFDMDWQGKLNPYNLNIKKKALEQFDINMLKTLSDVDLNTGRYNREGMRLTSDLQTADLQREIMKISANKSKAEIQQIQQNIENMKKQGTWQEMQNNLTEKMGRLNMTSADPAIFKFLSAIADKLAKK